MFKVMLLIYWQDTYKLDRKDNGIHHLKQKYIGQLNYLFDTYDLNDEAPNEIIKILILICKVYGPIYMLDMKDQNNNQIILCLMKHEINIIQMSGYVYLIFGRRKRFFSFPRFINRIAAYEPDIKRRGLRISMQEDSGLNRDPFYSEIMALIQKKQRMLQKLDNNMRQYEDIHKEMLLKQKKTEHERIYTNRIRKISNYRYFQQWRHSNVKYKQHKNMWFDGQHVIELLVTWLPKEQNGLKLLISQIIGYWHHQSLLKGYEICVEQDQRNDKKSKGVFQEKERERMVGWDLNRTELI
ncbi:unnamed protein product [Paramecium sonneborni]|uniref:Uncharacterized protein n=1 Tax=Paramecium sonneborni TaxID=65129 RepID=A0A8S1RUY8_9CILI|nr:unnamed protein product [Paramecium sonneborni]